MIGYKWVYKKDGQYLSLMNYGYYRMNDTIKTYQLPYEIGNTYINDEVETNRIKNQLKNAGSSLSSNVKTGFYFWVKNIKIND